jgi:predicted NAD-dependent protein-ADP-ribosyltransferase YbiA (DUF1768 family)
MTDTAADVRSTDQLLRFIQDGGQAKYLLFWGHRPPPAGGVGKGCLSQWWPAVFTVDGVSYSSAEHFMMAAKALLFGDADTAGRIRGAPHPGAAKELGSRVLAEASPRDRIWGIGLAADDDRATSPPATMPGCSVRCDGAFPDGQVCAP